jgi:DNA-binding CsgD family transcriptional regulator
MKTKDDLSPVQLRICELLCRGFSGKQIAEELQMSLAAVKMQQRRARLKTGSQNNVQLALFFLTRCNSCLLPKIHCAVPGNG